MIERVYYRVKLDANTFIYTPYLSNIPTSITDIPTNVTYDTTDGITLKTKETWTYDNNESSSVTAEREIPLKAGEGVTMDVSEDGKYVVIKVDPKRETHIGTSVPTDDYPDLFVNTADDSLSYKAPDGSWKPIAGGGSGGGLVDDVRVNGQSIVENKVANIVVDTELNEQSLNPIANSLFATRITAMGSTLSAHITNKNNPHNVTAAQIGLGNVNTELAAVEGDISAHKKDTDNPHNVTKSQVGLGNVDNTSDADKPVSTAQAAAIKVAKDDIIAHKNNKNNPHAVTAAQVGLGNVNNTSDANKPVSTAQQTALDKKIDKTGGTFSGNVAIQGNLTVSGTTTTESEKQLAVKENVIVTNADKVNLQTLLSGLAINKNSTATYGIMYDPADDTVKFGEGTLDANRKFVFKAGEGAPIATRADSSTFTSGHLVKWDATKKRLVDAGKSISEVGKTPKLIDAVNGAFTIVLYDTTDGITLESNAKITNTDDSEYTVNLVQEIPIKGGSNISIDKASDSDFVEVKLDQTQPITIKGNNAATFKADYSEQYYSAEDFLYMAIQDYNTIRVKNPNTYVDCIFPEANDSTSIRHYMLSDKNVKTLFGNQSIYGSGNIDLYQHRIAFANVNADIFFNFVVISSKNLNVDSLTDLKTLLGNTFIYPVNGWSNTQGSPIVRIDETGFQTGFDIQKGDWTTYPAGTWADVVTTI